VIHVGAVAPYHYTDLLTSAEWDLSGATAADFEVLHEDGTIAIWTATITEAEVVPGGSQVRLTHDFEEGDLTEPETLKIVSRVTIPAGVVLGLPAKLLVSERFV
jgi:hypothetical protein